jgi:hypothetical protein
VLEAVAVAGQIRMNPEQSKHLETAAMTIRGLAVEFVNLRAEEYSDASRIPTMVGWAPVGNCWDTHTHTHTHTRTHIHVHIHTVCCAASLSPRRSFCC